MGWDLGWGSGAMPGRAAKRTVQKKIPHRVGGFGDRTSYLMVNPKTAAWWSGREGGLPDHSGS